MMVEINDLQTIKNYAVAQKVTPSYIYKLVKENKMKTVTIDKVQFIDTIAYPNLPTKG